MVSIISLLFSLPSGAHGYFHLCIAVIAENFVVVKMEPVLKLLVMKDLPLIWLTVYQSYF